MSCRRHCHAAAHFILVRSLWVQGRSVQFGGAFIVSSVKCHLHLRKKLWLAVDEVVHHDNVMVPIIVRTWGNVAGLDHDRRDAGVVKHDPEEGEASMARRSRNETAEDEFCPSSKYSISVLSRR